MTSPATRPPSPPRRRRRRLSILLSAAVALALGAVGAVVAVSMPSASAASVSTSAWYVFVNHNSGKAMDVWQWSTAVGGELRQYTRTDGNNQQFQFVDAGSGYYKLKNRNSGLVVAIPNANDGVQVTQVAQSTDTKQDFRLADSSGGYVRFISRHSNKALDMWQWSTADGGMLSQYADLDGANQQWQLVQVGTGSGSTGGTSGSTPTGSWPSKSGDASVSGTISVSGTFDGGMKRYCCIGDGSQSESQDPMFELANGATIKNVIIGSPAGDGIHCLGTCTIQNVWWEDVGEDAATFLQTNGGTSYVIGGGAKSASDKVFQHNGNGTVNISGFYVSGIGKLYRACGNCTNSYQRKVVVSNVLLDNAKYVVGINTNWGDTATLSKIVVKNSSGIHICAEYQGVAKGSEPTYLKDGVNDAYCKFTSSDITYQ
jgi:pectate lyase